MSQDEISNPMDLVNGVCASAAIDAGLKARLLADPRATLAQETGLTIPEDWELVASKASDGTVRVELTNENIPEEYLQLVAGGLAGGARWSTDEQAFRNSCFGGGA